MKRVLTYIFIILSFLIFSTFIIIKGRTYNVIAINSPTELVVDFNSNGLADRDENVCVADIEAFGLENSVDFKDKYSKLLNISNADIFNLGYLSNEFAIKTLENKKVKVKLIKSNKDCKFVKITVQNSDYATLLYNSGFGLKNNKIGNTEKFKKNLEISKKLDLVIFNHHSNKYHKIDCEYGLLAHDVAIIPKKQLPKDAIPCKYCHNIIKHKKKSSNFFVNNLFSINHPPLSLDNGDLKIYHTDYTKHLKPDSKCNTDICKEFVSYINSSQNSIDIAIYGYEDNPSITTALKNANARGVKIRFVYDEASNPDNTFYKANYIIANLADYSKSDKDCDGAKLMHNKFVIFDDKIVFTGSMNFSPAGLSGYDVNDVLIIKSEPIAQLYKAEFEQMLNGKFHKMKTKHNYTNTFLLGNSTIEIYFSPQYKTGTRIVQLIINAKKYVYVPTYLITHKDITNALINAHRRGVDVKIITDANGVTTQNSKNKLLRDANIPLKVENYAGKLHSKSMVIDDEFVIIGSMNFSNSGENKNDENTIIVKNNEFAQNYKAFFNYLWKVIPDKYLKFNPSSEGKDSIGSCNDGVDNNFNGKTDLEEESCK